MRYQRYGELRLPHGMVTILTIFEEKVDSGSATLRYKRQRKKCSTREVVQKMFKRVIKWTWVKRMRTKSEVKKISLIGPFKLELYSAILHMTWHVQNVILRKIICLLYCMYSIYNTYIITM